jgi:tetratricopeptide (TPR) repeat protein
LGENRQAISDFNEAIRLDPKNAAAYNNRGLAYQSVKNSPQAISDYSQAIQLNPNYAEAYCNRGALYMNQGLVVQGGADLDRCGKLDPGYKNFIQKKTTEVASKKGKSVLKKLKDKLKKIF